ncbi:MAG: redoxin family protein [Myxococcota bacterium]
MRRTSVFMIAFAFAVGCTKPSPEPESAEAVPPDSDGTEAPAAEAVQEEASAVTTATVGAEAPDFTLQGLGGQSVTLSEFKGKTVVLEWFNPDCPFVKYSHGEGPLKTMAADTTAKDPDLVWLAINSGAPGKQGHGLDRNKEALKDYSMNHKVLVDESGKVGKLYNAKTTPHMFVINKAGELVYSGALDNAPMGKVAGDDEVNYVKNALKNLAAGEAVELAETRPYGCSVKYGS